VRIAPGMENARHLYVLVFFQGYWSVHSMTASFTIESCLEHCLQVMVMPGFRAGYQVFLRVLSKHYRANRRSFQ
jgi:hypothetical protein